MTEREIKLSSDKKSRPFNRSRFVTSPRSEEIFDIIRQYKGKIPDHQIWKKIKEIDPDVPTYTTFAKFLKRVDESNDKRAGLVMEKLKNQLSLEETGEDILKKLLETAYKKIFIMGNISIDQQFQDIKSKVEKGEKLNPLEQKFVMSWFFKGADAYNKHRAVDLKANADERAETLMDNLLMAAQYGKVTRRDIVDGETEEIISNPLKYQDGNA